MEPTSADRALAIVPTEENLRISHLVSRVSLAAMPLSSAIGCSPLDAENTLSP
jgi:hypothetical protein